MPPKRIILKSNSGSSSSNNHNSGLSSVSSADNIASAKSTRTTSPRLRRATRTSSPTSDAKTASSVTKRSLRNGKEAYPTRLPSASPSPRRRSTRVVASKSPNKRTKHNHYDDDDGDDNTNHGSGNDTDDGEDLRLSSDGEQEDTDELEVSSVLSGQLDDGDNGDDDDERVGNIDEEDLEEDEDIEDNAEEEEEIVEEDVSDPENGSFSSSASSREGEEIISQDTSRMTARQRALLLSQTIPYEEDDDPNGVPSLDTTLPNTRGPLTEEEQLRKSEKSRRRKYQRDQKLEQSKAETIQRLLQRQSSRSKKMRNSDETDGAGAPGEGSSRGTAMTASAKWYERPPSQNSIRLISNRKDGIMAQLGSQIPNIAGSLNVPADHNSCHGGSSQQKCSVEGCTGMRKYLHGCTGAPICSLKCYRQIK